MAQPENPKFTLSRPFKDCKFTHDFRNDLALKLKARIFFQNIPLSYFALDSAIGANKSKL